MAVGSTRCRACCSRTIGSDATIRLVGYTVLLLYPSRTGEAKRGLRQRARHAFAIVLLCEGE
jgi:hypothetical protein